MKPLKDKKLMLYFVGWEQDDWGIERPVTRPISEKPIWTHFRQVGGNEYYAAATAQISEEVIFTINWRDDFDTTALVVYKGKIYDITRLDTYEGYKDDLKLYCKLDPRQELSPEGVPLATSYTVEARGDTIVPLEVDSTVQDQTPEPEPEPEQPKKKQSFLDRFKGKLV